MERLEVPDQYVDAFCGCVPSSVLAKRYSEYAPEKLGDIYRGKKLINFYMRAMGEDGLFEITDFNELSVAVDIQVARVTFCTGALRVNGSYNGCIHREPIRPIIEDVWSRAAKRIGVPAWYLDEPLWSVGSRLCSKNDCKQCPIEKLCAKSFEVKFKGANIQV